ncbi:cwf18 pre-mRNA splicing factor-domain-containing protein [Sphaerosporella brunnea]|uniref:Cwf18 pre-mRNA splicing factor-domain-containing protein n=1 Tax=Sphaerosporella brunnea TaxID=1250544 RepID=A0A5J5EYS8_9PEZI|nr:cwf18 pre-mRNA splicing factor-domain-containing protein [Sphaerosporella brunnea]
MSTASLDAAAAARKERLSQLKSLKRKAPEPVPSTTEDAGTLPDAPSGDDSKDEKEKDISHLLSGRNYDVEDRAPKMGFASLPTEGQETLEARAAEIAKAAHEAERKDDEPVDLFSLQPKKPNWDLKRDVDRKLEMLKSRTDSAIARLVKARIEEEKKKRGEVDGEGKEVEGNIAKMVEQREKESDDLDGEVDDEE